MTLPPLARCFRPGLRNALAEIEGYRQAWRDSPSTDRAITSKLADWLESVVRAEYTSGVIARSFGLRLGLLLSKPRGGMRGVQDRVRREAWRTSR
jgi:hypothetical protein